MILFRSAAAAKDLEARSTISPGNCMIVTRPSISRNQLLAHDHDIRELMGARDLYIA